MIRLYYAVKPTTLEKVFFHADGLFGARRFAQSFDFIPVEIKEA